MEAVDCSSWGALLAQTGKPEFDRLGVVSQFFQSRESSAASCYNEIRIRLRQTALMGPGGYREGKPRCEKCGLTMGSPRCCKIEPFDTNDPHAGQTETHGHH